MRRAALIMGMPASIEIIDAEAQEKDIEGIFNYFRQIDQQFSPYKDSSELQKINRGEISPDESSPLMKKILKLSQETQQQTQGFFDINLSGRLDPSGIVKGFAIFQGAKKLSKKGFTNFYVEIGGDIQTAGLNSLGKKWRVGIRNPFNKEEIVKIVYLSGEGIATSGTYLRGGHIYDPLHKRAAGEIVSLSLIGKNIYEADRFATAIFAMGLAGMKFLESLAGFEGYMIDKNKTAYSSSGFAKYLT